MKISEDKFNMIGYQVRDYSNNDHGICQSNGCRERFKNWAGGLDLPLAEDNNDPVFRKYAMVNGTTPVSEYHVWRRSRFLLYRPVR